MSGEPRQRLPVTVAPGSRLEDLMARYDMLKAEYEEAKARWEELTGAIKAEGTAASPGATAMTLAGPPGMPALSLTYVESWRLDSKRLKEEDPRTYVQYAKKTAHWELRAL